MRSSIILLVSTLSLLVSSIGMAASTHPLNDIRDTAMNFVRSNLVTELGDMQISAKTLDTRLKLPLCEQALQAHMPYSNPRSNNTTVGVRCEGEQPWSLFVPVAIHIYDEIAVASRPLPQGKTLSAADIVMHRMDISKLAGGYLTQADIAIGQNLKRPIQVGQPILSNLLKAPTVIRRGQTITMLAKQSTFEVRSTGESLMDGAIGQRIKVRNRRSRRIVEGVITKDGLVYIN